WSTTNATRSMPMSCCSTRRRMASCGPIAAMAIRRRTSRIWANRPPTKIIRGRTPSAERSSTVSSGAGTRFASCGVLELRGLGKAKQQHLIAREAKRIKAERVASQERHEGVVVEIRAALGELPFDVLDQ